MRILTSFFIALAVVTTVLPAAARGGGHSGHATRTGNSKTHVSSYTRKDGAHVDAHNRSSADHIKANNWSTKGNANPETGKPGTK